MIDIDALVDRIASKEVTVGVVGLGYVGLPLALRFAEVGFTVLGFDISAERVAGIRGGESPVCTIPAERVARLVQEGRLDATADLCRLGEPDAVLICVPTPLGPHREPELSAVEGTAEALSAVLRPGQLISLESTSYPGTTEEVLLPRLLESGLSVGEDFFLAFSPEREDPGNPRFHTASIPRLVGGHSPACLRLALALYREAIDIVIPTPSIRVAEAAKVLENVYRCVNIALVNELKLVFRRMDIDIWDVIEAARTKPFGFEAFLPGPGVGGHCIPVDPFYLAWKARACGASTRFIELAGEVNQGMPACVVERLGAALNEKGRALRGSRVLVMGVTYKPDVGDLRESPVLEILEMLLLAGVEVEYADPYFPLLPEVRRHRLEIRGVEPTSERIRAADAVLLTTDHACFPYERIHEDARLVVDARGALRRRGLQGPRVVPA